MMKAHGYIFQASAHLYSFFNLLQIKSNINIHWKRVNFQWRKTTGGAWKAGPHLRIPCKKAWNKTFITLIRTYTGIQKCKHDGTIFQGQEASIIW